MLRVKAHLTVVADLRALGYHVDPPIVLDSATFAPHARKRLFIVAVRHRPGLDLGPSPKPLEFHYPAFRGQPPHPGEPPRTLDKTLGYKGLFKRDRLHALGNAVMPEMIFIIGQWLRRRLADPTPPVSPEVEGPLTLLPRNPLQAPAGARLWPTPVTTDSKGARKETARAEHWTSNPGTTLTDAVWLASKADYGRPLNPDWVERLMGFPAGFTLPSMGAAE
jgi:site-specific DNA-cytosine methylase